MPAAAPPSTTAEHHTAWELRVAIGRVNRRLRQGQVAGELTMSEASALARVEQDGPLTSGALAKLERVRPQAMCALINVLEEQGYVSRSTDPDDGRRCVMQVTGKGRQLLTDRRSISAQLMAGALAEHFTAAERQRLNDVVPLLERLAEQL